MGPIQSVGGALSFLVGENNPPVDSISGWLFLMLWTCLVSLHHPINQFLAINLILYLLWVLFLYYYSVWKVAISAIDIIYFLFSRF